MEEFYQLTKCDRRTCGSENIEQTSFSEIHGFFYICRDCGYTCWGGKSKNRVKNEKRPPCPSPADLEIDYCEMCQIPKEHLMHGETLETHHRNGDATNNDPGNLSVLCSACHSMVHHTRIYRGVHYMKRIGIYDGWMEKLKAIQAVSV
jgi:hypothetical protein